MLNTPQPQAAISISGDGIAAVGFTRPAGQVCLAVQEVIAFESGAVIPNIASSNIAGPELVKNALKEVLSKYKTHPKRIALVLPDAIAKVTLVSFDTVPDRTADLAQLIRLKIEKSAPFRLDEAQFSYISCGKTDSQQSQFLAVVVKRTVLDEYEDICRSVGLQVGRADLASFNLINTALYTNRKQQTGDWMLVHAAQDYKTVAIIREGQLIFYRTQTVDLSHSSEDFIYQATMYYEDRLAGAGIEQIVFVTSAIEGQSESLEPVFKRVFKGADELSIEQLGTRISESLHKGNEIPAPTLDSLAAPIGILLRDRHK